MKHGRNMLGQWRGTLEIPHKTVTQKSKMSLIVKKIKHNASWEK